MGTTKQTAKANFEKTPRKEAVKMALELQTELDKICNKATVAGSIRRGKEEIGDIDIVVIPKNLDTFYDDVKKIIEFEYGAKKKVFGMYHGRPINIFITNEESWGAQLMTATGPAHYNIRKRSLVKKRGYLLNEYGLFDRESNEYIVGATEKEIYEFLGWTNRPPNERK